MNTVFRLGGSCLNSEAAYFDRFFVVLLRFSGPVFQNYVALFSTSWFHIYRPFAILPFEVLSVQRAVATASSNKS